MLWQELCLSIPKLLTLLLCVEDGSEIGGRVMICTKEVEKGSACFWLAH